MNVFKSDKAPYILGLLVTVIGWHVTQIGNEVTKTQAVTYRLDVDPRTREIVVLIRNVSRTKSLVRATFSLDCPRAINCLEPLYTPEEGEDPVYGVVRAIAPNALAPASPPPSSAASVALINTVAAGGRYEIVARLARYHRRFFRAHPLAPWFEIYDPQIEFFFTPDPNRPLDILIYDSRSITGFLVENYFRILIVSFFLFAGLLLYSIASNLRSGNSVDSKGEGGDGG